MAISKDGDGIDSVIAERQRKFLNFLSHLFKKRADLAYILILIVIAIYALNVRTANIPALRDVTTGNYTLGPDLDPFLFLRWAKYIAEHGSLMKIDYMRYVPVGYKTSDETALVSYIIAYLYKFLQIFHENITIEFVAIIYPVIFFIPAIIAFFLFTRRVFAKYSVHKRNVAALIATAFFAVMPSLIHRTVAGIPEKEAGGIFFMFLALYLFVVSLQSKNKTNAAIFGILAGASTALLGLVWGAVGFVTLGIAAAMIACFLLDNISEKDFVTYASWLIIFSLLLSVSTSKYGRLTGLLLSSMSMPAYILFFIWSIHLVLSKTLYKKLKTKIPHTLISFILVGIVGIVMSLLINPEIITHTIGDIQNKLIHPLGTDRIMLTVAENNQPYFSSWSGTFGMGFFWLFLFASVLLFYEALEGLKRYERYIMSGLYLLFMIALIFSRYSASAPKMNGTSSTSLLVYFGGFVVFILSFVALYSVAFRNNEIEKFKKIKKEIVLLLVFFFWFSIASRGAIRLLLLLAPIASILAGFICADLIWRALKSKEQVTKVIMWIVAIGVIALVVMPAFNRFNSSSSYEARYTRPSTYNIQWQYAMAWVRDNTPQNAVFSHWWDYGYWVQTIGERATFLDGGNTIGYWDYLMGRYVLTGQNEREALEVLKAHNVSYLLIDSTDIGKYTAYSSIGSDLQYDRYNWIPTVTVDEKQMQEKRNETIYPYPINTLFSKEFTWFNKQTKKQYIFPPQNTDAIIGWALLPIEKVVNATDEIPIKQPSLMVLYKKSERVEIPMCYAYVQGRIYDFKENGPCMPAALYIIPKLISQGNSIGGINYLGAAFFLNEKALNALWVKLYLFNESTNFQLVHTEDYPMIKELKEGGAPIPEIVVLGDVLGPIKIWKVNYPDDIKVKEEYLQLNYPDERLIKSTL